MCNCASVAFATIGCLQRWERFHEKHLLRRNSLAEHMRMGRCRLAQARQCHSRIWLVQWLKRWSCGRQTECLKLGQVQGMRPPWLAKLRRMSGRSSAILNSPKKRHRFSRNWAMPTYTSYVEMEAKVFPTTLRSTKSWSQQV